MFGSGRNGEETVIDIVTGVPETAGGTFEFDGFRDEEQCSQDLSRREGNSEELETVYVEMKI